MRNEFTVIKVHITLKIQDYKNKIKNTDAKDNICIFENKRYK